MDTVLCQERSDVLHDEGRPWRAKKERSIALANLYYSLHDDRKGDRVMDCATQLGFAVSADGHKTLCEANFCRVRLCPMCAWRRSLKIYSQVCACIGSDALHGLRYIFLTLTCRNCGGDDLPSVLDSLLEGWRRLTRNPVCKAAFRGWLRSVEVTAHLSEDGFTSEYHPHIHALIAVKPSYFSGRQYISQELYRQLWRDAMRLSYLPVVHVEKCHGCEAAVVAEATKYATKDADYLLPDDWVVSAERVLTLDRAFYKRRFLAFGGAFADARKELQLEDPDTGDLVRVADGDGDCDGERVYYGWLNGYNEYFLRR